MRFDRTFVLCLVVAPFISYGQIDPNNHHIINYRDGSVFIGSVIKTDQYQTVILATTGDSLHLNTSKIRKWRTVSDKIALKDRGKFHYKKGIFASFDMGASFDDDASGQFNLIIGVRKDAKMSFGLGTGIHINSKSLTNFWIENDFVPIYAYGRRYLGNRNSGPFVSTKIGYGFPLTNDFFRDEFVGGFYAQPGVGLHFASRGKYRFIISLSEYIQHTNGSQSERDFTFNNPIVINYSIWYTRLMLKVGIEFR